MFYLLLKKIIRTASGRTRFAMAIIGLSVALLLIFSAVQIEVNYNDLLNNKTNQDSIANFLVVNKLLTSKTIGATTLQENEIKKIKQQPFIDDIGILTPSRYKASVQSYSDRFPFYTEISFESVPSSFIDVNSKDWKWDDQSNYIPMIAPNMFLDFYNFQFSLSQNLPQLTQEVVKMIVFKVNINTASGIKSFNGRVIGFSDRITSLLVPQEFMDWANKQYGTTQNTQPSRVIIRTKDPGNPQLVQYLKENNLVTDADKTRFSKYRQIVNTIVNVSWITGAVMLLFALLIFTLFIQLTIASCKEEIELLITLGASPNQLQRFLMQQFFPSNIIIVAIALIAVSALQYILHQFLFTQNIFISTFTSTYVLFTALIVLLVLWIVNITTIKKYISLQDK
jgi:cell division protein FtsX